MSDLERLASLLDEEEIRVLADAAEAGLFAGIEFGDVEEDEMIAALTESLPFRALQARVKRNHKKYAQNLADGILTQKRPVDQREIDEKRGYFRGAKHYILYLPAFLAGKLEDQAKESE